LISQPISHFSRGLFSLLFYLGDFALYAALYCKLYSS